MDELNNQMKVGDESVNLNVSIEISKSGQQRENKRKKRKKKKRNRQMKRATGDLWEYNKGSNICAIRDPEGEDEEGGAAKYANIWQKDF